MRSGGVARMRRRGVDLPTLGLLAGMYGLLVGNALLYAAAPLPLPVHVLISAVAIHLAFTIWHEAAHRNLARSPAVNDLLGVLGMLPYMTPYFLQKYVHLQHHARLNEPGDPNRLYAEGSFLTLPLRYARVLSYAKRVLDRDPRKPLERRLDAAWLVALGGIFATAALLGWLRPLVLLWVLPLAIAKVVMDWYINWAPHVGLPPDRWRGTRVLDIPWLTPLVLAHNYHAIHHLWPSLPWHRYPAVFREKEVRLRERGVPIARRLSGAFRRAASGEGVALPG